MKNNQWGGIGIRILIVFISLIVIGGAIVIILTNNQAKQQIYYRKVNLISEYGLMIALQKLHQYPSWYGNINKTMYEDGWYRVKMKKQKNADTLFLVLSSEGHFKSASDTKQCILSLSIINGDSLWNRRSMQ